MVESISPGKYRDEDPVVHANASQKFITPASVVGNLERLKIYKEKNGIPHKLSIAHYAEGFNEAGALVFCFIDGNGKIILPTDEEDIYEILQETGDVKVLSYNPKPITIEGRIEKFDPENGIGEMESI